MPGVEDAVSVESVPKVVPPWRRPRSEALGLGVKLWRLSSGLTSKAYK